MKIKTPSRNIFKDLSWGSHICHFYRTRDDLTEILVPYFKSGLENGEYCLWITSAPLEVEEAQAVLKNHSSFFASHFEKGQIEVLDSVQWYGKSGKFNADRVLRKWNIKEKEALAMGYKGLRAAGNMSWLDKRGWKDFMDYEEEVNNVIGENHFVALCSYFLDQCEAHHILDVFRNHRFSFIKRGKNWDLVESYGRRQIEDKLLKANEQLDLLQKVTAGVHSSLELKKVFREITGGTVRSLGYTSAFILIQEKKKGNFQMKSFSTKRRLLHHINQILGFPIQSLRFSVDQAINPTVSSVMDGEIVVAKSLYEIASPLLKKATCTALQKLGGSRRFIIVPLRSNKDFRGCLFITSRKNEVSRKEMVMLKSFASVASNAISNANLYEQSVQIKKDMRLSEERNRELVEKAGVAILIDDREGNIQYANKMATTIYGYSLEELRGQSIETLVHPDDLDRVRKFHRSRLQGKRAPSSYMFKGIRKDGAVRYLDIHVVPIRKRKVIHGTRIYIKDMTEQKLAAHALKESEEKYRDLVEKAGIGILIDDREGRFVYTNKRYAEIFGYSLEEMRGTSILSVVHADDRERVMEYHRARIQGLRAPQTYEFKGIKKDGSVIYLEVYAVRLKEGKETGGTRAYIRDITKRRNAEGGLRESEMRYRVLFEHARDAVFLLDLSGNHIMVNKVAARMLGYSRDELIGKSFREIVTPAEFSKAQGKLKGLIEGKTFPPYERIFRKKDGTEVPVEINISLIYDPTGKPFLVQSVVRNITLRKKTEEELKNSREGLRSLAAHLETVREEERTAVAREIHDELGQQLTALKMDLTWIGRRLTKEQEPLLEKKESMTQLLDETILTVKRICSELRPGVLDDLGLPAALEWQAQEVKKRTGIRCVLHINPIDFHVSTKLSTAIFRIFQEACTNVIRHSQADSIRVYLNKDDSRLELRVEDNGIGIREEQMADSKSFGLLGIRERVHALGGEVRINGIPDRGTKLSVSIPL